MTNPAVLFKSSGTTATSCGMTARGKAEGGTQKEEVQCGGDSSKKDRPACYLIGFRRDAMETTFNNRRPACQMNKSTPSSLLRTPTRSVELRLVRVRLRADHVTLRRCQSSSPARRRSRVLPGLDAYGILRSHTGGMNAEVA